MANTVSRFTGTDPNGDIGIMAKLTITSAGFFHLAAMKEAGLDPADFGAVNDRYGDGTEYSLDYTQFIPIMWEIIKELRRKIS